MSTKKQLPPPADDGLGDTLRRRLTRTDKSGTSGDTSRTPRTSETSRTDRTDAIRATAEEAPRPVRRSWYMPKAAADGLAAVVDDLHFETRRPKHEVLAALVAVALEHRDSARDRLNGQQ